MQAYVTLEDQLILFLSRGELPLHVQERALALLATPLRWDLILKRATAHEVYPLLYRNLRRFDYPGVPTQICAELEALYKVNAFRSALLAEELERVLKLLGGAGIATVPLKGVALAESLYGDLTLRVCADIDILVPHRAVAQAFRLLTANGYRAEFAERFFEDLLLHSNIEYALMREERGIDYPLELHWGLLWGSPFDGGATEDLWAEVRPKAFFGVSAYALSSEWELLFLTVHAARHQWQGLKWLVDIHEICSRGEINWEKVTDKANALGWEQVVRLTLSACHALFDTPIPAHFSLDRLPSWVKLFPADSFPSNIWKDAIFPTGLLKQPSERLRYILRVLLVPTLAERRLLRLPSSLGFLYYSLRPLRSGCHLGWWLVCAGCQRLKNVNSA